LEKRLESTQLGVPTLLPPLPFIMPLNPE
jgi:hypothetical protein